MTPKAETEFADLESEYAAIVARAREVAASFPPLLRCLAEPLLPELARGEFSRIVALLPYWVTSLLSGLEPTVGDQLTSPDDEAEILGLANLLGWWSYLIQDRLLDRDLDRLELLPLSTAFHVAAVRLLERLLPGHQAFWDTFQHLSLTSAEAHGWEQRHHRWPLTGPVDEIVDLTRLADRSALLQLAVAAQFALRGYEQDHPLSLALGEALRQYAIARQIGDDLTDWLDDLRRGRLNYVSACIARRMKETDAIQACDDLSVDQMAGFFLYDDELFTAIQQTARDACRRAAASLAPYESRCLDRLVDELLEQLEGGYKAALQARRELRAQFPSPTI